MQLRDNRSRAMHEDDLDDRMVRTDAPTASIAPGEPLDVDRLPDDLLTPGMQLGGRYRIVTRLGYGGLGVVYRADDLKLGEPVALKFLRGASTSASRIAMLVDEVRLGRKIAHPNVCRLHDLVVVGTHHFISMEYVEGEDLGRLVKRVGRLPSAQAVMLARDICAGVQALHDAGIVHRDLKPANVMVDPRGRGRLTDFGLAASLDEPDPGERLSGTPLYMAPEQFSGAPSTRVTDIYALGLVLWEIFAGQRAIEASTLEGVYAFHGGGGRVPRLAAVVPDIAAPIEDVVARCLDPDPGRRPRSAREILRVLPGGDALDAALEAGETPTPEMVAAASLRGDLSRAVGSALLVALLATVAFNSVVFERSTRRELLARIESPSRMQDRVKTLLDRLGIPSGRDQAGGWVANETMVAHLARGKAEGRWAPLFEPASPFRLYWHRTGPNLTAWSPGRTTFSDPPYTLSGMSGIALDPEGRLLRLRYVPDGRADAARPEVTWEDLFAEAGLDPRRFEGTSPPIAPASGADRARAWRGASPHVSGTEIFVVAGWLGRTPVWFDVLYPWDLEAARGLRSSATPKEVEWLFGAFLVVVVAGAALVARRNIRRGRGDARGAWNVAIFLSVSWAGFWVMRTEARNVQEGIAYGALITLCAWVAYVAVEPEVRRRWPRVLVGWTRLVHGRVFDPRVGSEVLVGMLAAVLIRVATTLVASVMTAMGEPGPDPSSFALRDGALGQLREILFDLVSAPLVALALLTALALMSFVLRRLWVGITLLSILIVAVFAPAGAGVFAVVLVLPLVLLMREGLLAAVATYFTLFLQGDLLGLRLDEWYAPQVVVATAAMAALALYAWATSIRLGERADA
jgi:serine/threonine protein kinase